MRGVSFAMLILGAIAIHFVTAGRDTAFAPDPAQWDAVILIQLYLALLAMPSLLLAAVVTERQRSYAGLQAEIAERQRAEAVQARLIAILESTSDLVAIATPEGKVTYLNRAGRKLAGRSTEEPPEGRLIRDFHPDWAWRKVEREGLPTAAATGHWEGETALLSEGREVPVSQAILAHRSAAGTLKYFSTIIRDITERKRAEVLLQSQAKHLEQLVQERTAELKENISELEAFSYTIAHDMRAPLRAILSYTQLLQQQRQGQANGTGTECLDRIAEASMHMDRLIQDILALSRVSRTQIVLQPVEVEQVLQGIVHSSPTFQPPQAAIQVKSPLPVVLANEAALTQCVSNLLGNAVKFVAPGTTPRIEIWAERLNRPEGDRGSGGPGGPTSPEPRVRLWFADNGIGIPRDQQERIFEVFQRVDKSYEGTGIGLAIVRKAMQRMGGEAGVESEPGKGSRFWLEFREAKREERG